MKTVIVSLDWSPEAGLMSTVLWNTTEFLCLQCQLSILHTSKSCYPINMVGTFDSCATQHQNLFFLFLLFNCRYSHQKVLSVVIVYTLQIWILNNSGILYSSYYYSFFFLKTANFFPLFVAYLQFLSHFCYVWNPFPSLIPSMFSVSWKSYWPTQALISDSWLNVC